MSIHISQTRFHSEYTLKESLLYIDLKTTVLSNKSLPRKILSVQVHSVQEKNTTQHTGEEYITLTYVFMRTEVVRLR